MAIQGLVEINMLTNELGVLVLGFCGGAISSMFILAVTQTYWKASVKKYNMNRPQEIDALKMRLCSLETIINQDLHSGD